jgi:pimeloyl-ACP methyl ester carboxylesterase
MGTGFGEMESPTVDEISARSLYSKSTYYVDTPDRWSLAVTRYQPVPQAFSQPLFGEPILLVHGFSQNRHAWSSGEFVKNLLFFGLDVHILELRGHGKSSQGLQRERARELGRPLPDDLEFGWDIDSYFADDVPAAIEGVKRVTGHDQIFLCGHSMGGMLAYGHAGLRTDLAGLVTIGAASDLGRGFPLLRAVAHVAPAVGSAVDVLLSAFNLEERLRYAGRRLLTRGKSPANPPAGRAFRAVPLDAWLRALEQMMAFAEQRPVLRALASRANWLTNPARVSAHDIRWLLREGGEREPRRVIEQFGRWIRRGELRCYRTGYDFKQGFRNIRIPMAIIFGDLDPLASVASTRSVYHAAQSDYLLWRPVKGNSHLELTMGHDIRQICYDIKNLVEYARTHRHRAPRLPRRAP